MCPELSNFEVLLARVPDKESRRERNDLGQFVLLGIKRKLNGAEYVDGGPD